MKQQIGKQSVIRRKRQRATATATYSILTTVEKTKEDLMQMICGPEPMFYNGKRIPETSPISIIID